MFTNGRVLWKSLIILGHSKNEYSIIWTRGLTVYKDLSLSAVIAIDNAIFLPEQRTGLCVALPFTQKLSILGAFDISRTAELGAHLLFNEFR